MAEEKREKERAEGKMRKTERKVKMESEGRPNKEKGEDGGRGMKGGGMNRQEWGVIMSTL